MGGFTDLIKGERGLFALVLTAASTVLTALGHMTIDAWRDFNLYVYGLFVFGKTATTVTGLIKGTLSPDATTPTPAPAPTPEPPKS